MSRGKVYTHEFKDEAVCLSQTSGKSVARVAKDLGISYQSLREMINGMDDNAADEDFVCFRPLAKINSVPATLSKYQGSPDYSGMEMNLPDAANHFVIADHLIWLFIATVKLTAEPSNAAPVLRIHDADTWSEVAETFEEFLRMSGVIQPHLR